MCGGWFGNCTSIIMTENNASRSWIIRMGDMLLFLGTLTSMQATIQLVSFIIWTSYFTVSDAPIELQGELVQLGFSTKRYYYFWSVSLFSHFDYLRNSFPSGVDFKEQQCSSLMLKILSDWQWIHSWTIIISISSNRSRRNRKRHLHPAATVIYLQVAI